MTDSPFYIKHKGKLDPVVSRDINLATGDIPQWSDEDQHLSKSDITQTENQVLIDNKLVVSDDTTIHGSLDLDTGDLTITGDGNIEIVGTGGITINDGDLHIKGNIVQEGDSYETHAEQLYTTKDHIILREGAIAGLFENEHSGIIVSKYDGENNIHLCVNKRGYAQVGETDDNGDPYEVEYSYEFTDTGVYKRDGKYWDSDDKTTEEFNTEHAFYIPADAYDVEIGDNSDPDYEPPSQDDTPQMEPAGSLETLYETLDIGYRYTEANSVGFYFDFENPTANYTWVPASDSEPQAHYELSGTAKWIDDDGDMVRLVRVEKRDGQIYLNTSIEADTETLLYNGIEIRNALPKRLFKEEAYDSFTNDGSVFLSTVEYRNNIYWTTWSDGTSDSLDGASMLYHMVTPEISNFLGEPVDVHVSYKLKESSLQRLLTIEPKPQPNSLLYYDEVSKQARTLQLPEDNTIPLVPVLENGRIAYRKYKQNTNVSFDVSVSQIAFDAAHPIDEVYTQYPWQLTPEEVYNKNGVHSIWERIKDYDGAFFRAEGGLADPFQNEKQTGIVYKVIESPLVFLQTVYRLNISPLTHDQVQIGYRTNNGYGADATHILEIRELEGGEYEVKTEDNRTQTIPGTETIYNYNVPVGTLEQIVNRRTDWTVEIHDDFSTDTTNGSAVISTASNANPSTAQHSVRITPVIGSNYSTSLSESGVYSVLNNRSQLMYNKNVNLGHLESLFTKWKVETVDDDNYIASPSYEDPLNIYTTANNANPTDAQIIVSVEQAEGTTTYNVRYKDGSTANFANTAAWYCVHTNPNGTKTVTNMGQIQAIFHEWQHTQTDPDDFYWEFPETDDYCFTTTNIATPTDAQIVWRVWGDYTQGTCYACVQYKDGHSTWSDYNDLRFYFVNRLDNTAVNMGLTCMWMTHGEARFTKETKSETIYLPANDDDLTLSIASQAAPTVANQVNYVRVIDGTHYIIVRNDSNTTVYNTTGISTILYNKNVVWGSVNATKLRFTKSEETDDYYHRIVYTPSQILTDNSGNTILRVYQEDALVGTETGRYVETLVDGAKSRTPLTNSVSVYDSESENYAISWELLIHQCITSATDIDYYAPPECGTFYNSSSQYIYNTAASSRYIAPITTIDDWSANRASEMYDSNPSYYPAVIESIWTMPGSIMPIRQAKDKTLSTVATQVAISCYCGDIEGPSMAGIIYGHDYVKRVNHNPFISVPKAGIAFRGTSATAANQIVNARYAISEDRILLKQPNGFYYRTDLDAETTLWTYDEDSAKYTQIIGVPRAIYTVKQMDYGNEDILYYYPPRYDWRGDEYVPSIASNANPTDAQIITKIDPLEGTTQYNVHFADGHQAVYANTQGIYNRNLYYTTIQGIVDIYANMTYDTVKVQYNKAVGNWTISNVPIVYTRYTGCNAGGDAYFTYDDENLTTATLRNNNASMTDGSRTLQLGLSQAWIRDDDSYTLVQREALPNIQATWRGYNQDGASGAVDWYAYDSAVGGNPWSPMNHFRFDASKYNATYGRRDEVAPKNLTIRIWRRVK